MQEKIRKVMRNPWTAVAVGIAQLIIVLMMI
jgi:hypothetical protein